MTIMLRTLGVPSREVNGFLPGEYNDLGGDYIVRASDAHSWVEVYFPGNEWQVFDPTPASPENETGILTRLGAVCRLDGDHLERMGNRLRLRPPGGPGAEPAAGLAKLERIRARLVRTQAARG